MKCRLISSCILIIVVLGILFLSSLIEFALINFAICILSCWEWGLLAGLIFTRHKIYWMTLCILLLLCVTLAFLFNYFFVILWFLKYIAYISLIWWISILFMILSYSDKIVFWRNTSIIRLLFGILTILPFFISILVLRQYNYNNNPYIGAWWLLYVMILVWSVDSGAYIFGRLFGHFKLAPKISYNKTWEGVLGGLLTSSITCILFYKNISMDISPFILFICTFVTIICSIFGDLFESMLKRIANVKDSGNIILGHGGILDRINSLIIALPVFVYLVLFVFNVI